MHPQRKSASRPLVAEEHERPFADIDHAFQMLRCGPSKRPFVHCAAFMGVKHRSADIAVNRFSLFACAETSRTCGVLYSAPQRIPRLRAFVGIQSCKIQTVPSLQPGPTFEERTKQAFAALTPKTVKCSPCPGRRKDRQKLEVVSFEKLGQLKHCQKTSVCDLVSSGRLRV